jgi:hypothetical protein
VASPRRCSGASRSTSPTALPNVPQQHAWVEVQTRDRANGPDTLRGKPGHHPGSASDVQHPLAWAQRRHLEEILSHRASDGRDEMPLVILWPRAAINLTEHFLRHRIRRFFLHSLRHCRLWKQSIKPSFILARPIAGCLPQAGQPRPWLNFLAEFFLAPEADELILSPATTIRSSKHFGITIPPLHVNNYEKKTSGSHRFGCRR